MLEPVAQCPALRVGVAIGHDHAPAPRLRDPDRGNLHDARPENQHCLHRLSPSPSPGLRPPPEPRTPRRYRPARRACSPAAAPSQMRLPRAAVPGRPGNRSGWCPVTLTRLQPEAPARKERPRPRGEKIVTWSMGLRCRKSRLSARPRCPGRSAWRRRARRPAAAAAWPCPGQPPHRRSARSRTTSSLPRSGRAARLAGDPRRPPHRGEAEHPADVSDRIGGDVDAEPAKAFPSQGIEKRPIRATHVHDRARRSPREAAARGAPAGRTARECSGNPPGRSCRTGPCTRRGNTPFRTFSPGNEVLEVEHPARGTAPVRPVREPRADPPSGVPHTGQRTVARGLSPESTPSRVFPRSPAICLLNRSTLPCRTRGSRSRRRRGPGRGFRVPMSGIPAARPSTR